MAEGHEGVGRREWETPSPLRVGLEEGTVPFLVIFLDILALKSSVLVRFWCVLSRILMLQIEQAYNYW